MPTEIKNPQLVSAAFKTVAIFAGIIKHPIWLKNGVAGKTDGRYVVAPFDDKDFYLLVERQLSHILFRSDARARTRFVSDFIGQISKLYAQYGISDEEMDRIKRAIERTIDILESRRIESLWGMIYPGSRELSRIRLREDATRLLDRAHHNFFDLFICLDAGLDVPPGPLDPYRPLFESALAQVERRGFAASLALARWLVSKLVDLILQQDQLSYRAAPHAEAGSNGVEGGAGPPNPRERLLGLQSMARQFGEIDPNMDRRYNDYETSRFIDKSFHANSLSAASTALEVDLRDPGALEQVLAASEAYMQSFLDSIQQQLRQPVDHDDWLRKETFCKLHFVDVYPGEVPVLESHDPEDRQIVRRLKAQFFRVLGRRAWRLDDCGTEIDVQAFLEQKTSREPVPYFKTETSGRGFRALLLLDRSKSMTYQNRMGQAERAARVLSESMDFPFVDLSVWGFQSLEDGEVTVTRFSPRLDTFHTQEPAVDGCTPLHIALKVAVRELLEGTEVKQLLILTDGEPMYVGANHRPVPERQLRLFVREQILFARKRGINVTALLIGDRKKNGAVRFPVSRETCKFMFGLERYWKYIDDRRLGEALVSAVSDSFVSYLRSA